MGGSSSSLGGGDAYALKAEKAKKLSDDILQLFFTNANLLKLLKLHNIAECSRFVFTTSTALDTLFQRLQLYPKLGKKGEYLFSPVSDLAPGLIQGEKANAKLQDKIHERNTMCLDVGYFYVRIFQIYTALALTTINTNPVRVRRGTTLKNPVRGGPQQATLLGGARPSSVNYGPTVGSGAMMVQLGGAAPAKTGKFAALYNSIKTTPFVPFLALGLFDTTTPDPAEEQYMKIKGSEIYVRWPVIPRTKMINDYEVDGVFRTRTGEKAIKIRMTLDDEGKKAVLTYADTTEGKMMTQEFAIGGTGSWLFDYGTDGKGKSSSPSDFFEEINALYTTDEYGTGSGSYGTGSGTGYGTGSGSGSSYPGSSSSGIGSAGGTSSFEGFDALKKLFQDTAEKGAEFPKAYCIARAMTLLNPLFASELSAPNQPSFSQVCRPKYDFDPTDLMPRPGKSARANMYLKSLVSLYYDEYKYNRGTGKVELTQSEPSRSSLRAASQQFGKLYNLPGDQSGFLSPDETAKSSVNFPAYPLCGKNANRLLKIRQDKPGKELLARLQAECIKPMLDFQESHTIQVNKLLMKMFKIETTQKNGRPQTSLRLQPAIKAAGIAGINAIGVEAHDLLLNYYLKSEAFYIRGIYLMEQNPHFDPI